MSEDVEISHQMLLEEIRRLEERIELLERAIFTNPNYHWKKGITTRTDEWRQ